MKIQILPTPTGFMLCTDTSVLEISASKREGLKLSSNKVVTLKQGSVPTSAVFVDALLGIVRGVSKKTYYLLVVTKSAAIGTADSLFQARSIQEIQLIPFPEQHETDADRLQLEYIERSLKNIPHLYFSHTHDLVRSTQNQRLEHEQSGSKHSSLKASLFVWNWKFLEPLFDAQVLEEWIHPIIQGLVAYKPGIRVLDVTLDLVLITRRAITHQGTRFNCRGLDSKGNAANFCETEQILLFNGDLKGGCTSFLQVRGSVPTSWTQSCSLSPVQQRVKVHSDTAFGFGLFLEHLRNQMTQYGKELIFVNLIDKQGKSGSSKDQAALGSVFESHMDTLVKTPSDENLPHSRFYWFDFHHETKSQRGGWYSLSKLLRLVEPELSHVGFCADFTSVATMPTSMRRSTLQHGCFRVNCMDNLDRTNVVQSIFARASALEQLSFVLNKDLKSSLTENVFDSGFPEFESAFKEMWGDNADAVSLAYAGSNALKTDFTRTGKRSRWGLIQDAINSITRLFVNNFLDAYRQDEIDVLLGKEEMIHSVLERMAREKSWVTPAKARLGVLAIATLGCFTPFIQRPQPSTTQFSYLIAWGAIAAYVIVSQSRERPRFFSK